MQMKHFAGKLAKPRPEPVWQLFIIPSSSPSDCFPESPAPLLCGFEAPRAGEHQLKWTLALILLLKHFIQY